MKLFPNKVILDSNYIFYYKLHVVLRKTLNSSLHNKLYNTITKRLINELNELYEIKK